ncbi:MAG: hypothetical protein AAB539_00060 [Patescibacteria group bacterium]
MTNEELQFITNGRLESAQILIEHHDWFWASYTMAMTLECALKAAICKTLNLRAYPDPKSMRNDKIINIFYTHEFEQLKLLAGLNEVFSPSSGEPEIVRNWSEFTKEFPGSWSDIRYDYNKQQQFDAAKAPPLYKNLTHPKNGIITKIKEKW